MNIRQPLRLQLEAHGKELRFQVELSVLTCSCPAALASTLEQGLADQDLRVYRETNERAGTATLHAYRFTMLPTAFARAFERYTRATREAAEGRRPQPPPDATKIIADAIASMGGPPPGWGEESPQWVAVFETATLIRSGVELLLVNEREADAVLPVLARAWNRQRAAIEIKPPASWGWGYEAYRPRE